jgi:hypothetical protein
LFILAISGVGRFGCLPCNNGYGGGLATPRPVIKNGLREFFQSIDYQLEEGAARYYVNVLLNYLVLMGQKNRARYVWKVAYENKLFPKTILKGPFPLFFIF